MAVRGWKDAMYKAMGMPKYMATKKHEAEKGLQEIGRKARNEVMSLHKDWKTAHDAGSAAILAKRKAAGRRPTDD